MKSRAKIDGLALLGLKHNPFEPAASGPALMLDQVWLPTSWRNQLTVVMDQTAAADSPKAVPIVGMYGGGKTVVLRWLDQQYFSKRKVKAYYFENPGVRFYDLANHWLRQIGRYELTKTLLEYLGPDVKGLQRGLFGMELQTWLRSVRSKRDEQQAMQKLQEAIRGKDITDDEEIAHRMARLLVGTPTQPYFEYRDFVAGRPGALVAQGQEARYFKAFIRALRLASGVERIAFLIDEFEEIALQTAFTKREAHEYLSTMKRLIDLSMEEDLWVVVSMTQEALKLSKQLTPACMQRFAQPFSVPPLTHDESVELVDYRLRACRPEDAKPSNPLHPFPEDFADALQKDTLSVPRRLVQWAFAAISRWDRSSPLPFSHEYLKQVERTLLGTAEPEVEGDRAGR